MRIEGGEHSLDGRLRRFFVIDVAGIIAGDGGDCFVVVFFDLVGDAVRVFVFEEVKPLRFRPLPTVPPKMAATRINDRRGDRKLPVHPRPVSTGILQLACNFHWQNITQARLP